MAFLKNLFSKDHDWNFPRLKIELLAPIVDYYKLGSDQPIQASVLNNNGADMTDYYMNKYLEPRVNLFDRFADENTEIKRLAQDSRHPINRLASDRARTIADEFQLEDHSIHERATIYATLSTLVVDGFIVSLVEKRLSGLPKQSVNSGLSISQVTKDFLIVTAYRNWTGDVREIIDTLADWPRETDEILIPPPFGPAPHDPHWSTIRYLIDYGFYCGTIYLGMGRRQFEKTMVGIP